MFKKPLILLGLGVSLLQGCNTTDTGSDVSAKNLDKSDTVTVTAQELAELKSAAQQWNESKEGIARLLIIEQDLKLLITQLSALEQENKQTPSASSSAAIEKPISAHTIDTGTKALDNKTIKNVPVMAAAQEKSTSSHVESARYALQVLSVTQKGQLSNSLQTMKNTAPALFDQSFETNVETAKVNNITYYRLKLGAYQSKENAQAACKQLKAAKINCLVSTYVKQPLLTQ
ncbi:SPOR domain-containing protein [Pseudoalteromonas sp. MMG010]|uniref:SPOR domain-containing protein n=1 Tax=Pseudoalteromonas sp. MMG010 TaxID=2822685 RepID=UPI001B3A158B|nr:SPOR domain-containing protein [Pseudoalteromonas sp. MMG010]MBQ4831896.1 SPOR domain-containing protein [Pseudoalteromonas sp. MMG010]